MKVSSDAMAPAAAGWPVMIQLQMKVSAVPTARQLTALATARAWPSGEPTMERTLDAGMWPR